MTYLFISFSVNCKIGSWSEWDICSVTCGKGTKSRNRQILVAPANGGQPCQATTESSPCNTGYCPSKQEKYSYGNLKKNYSGISKNKLNAPTPKSSLYFI